jgi:hypothetical protein
MMGGWGEEEVAVVERLELFKKLAKLRPFFDRALR